MDLGTLASTALATASTDLTTAFTAAAPVVVLVAGSFLAWRYVKRIIGKI